MEDIFILAPSKLLKDGRYFGGKTKYLAYQYGEKIPVSEVHYGLGGSACNAIVAMAKMGIKSAFATVLGSNSLNSEVLQVFKKHKISTKFILRGPHEKFGFSLVLIGPDGDRTILIYREKNDYSKIDVKKIVKASDAVYVGGIAPHFAILQEKILGALDGTSKKLYLNPSGYQLEKQYKVLKKMVARSEIVAVNFEEALQLTRKSSAEIKDLLCAICNMGAAKVIVTRGRHGAFYHDGSKFFKVSAMKIKARGSAGSGDAFFGSFVATQIKGFSTEDSLKFAAINGAGVASFYGAQKGQMNLRELKEIARKNKVKVSRI